MLAARLRSEVHLQLLTAHLQLQMMEKRTAQRGTYSVVLLQMKQKMRAFYLFLCIARFPCSSRLIYLKASFVQLDNTIRGTRVRSHLMIRDSHEFPIR